MRTKLLESFGGLWSSNLECLQHVSSAPLASFMIFPALIQWRRLKHPNSTKMTVPPLGGFSLSFSVICREEIYSLYVVW